MQTALPDGFLVVSSKEVHEERQSQQGGSRFDAISPPFGTKELITQVVHIGSAAGSHIHTTSELLYLLK